MFFIFAPTYYYYIMLVIPFLYLASRIETPINGFGITWLFLSSNIAYLFHDTLGRHLALFYALSMLFLGLCIIMVTAALLRSFHVELRLSREEAGSGTAGPSAST